MQRPSNERQSMRTAIIAAIVAALVSVAGAGATTVFVTSKQIKNGSILSQDIHRGAVQTSDLQNGGVKSTDIANGSVSSPDIGADAVGSSEIGSNAVTSGEIAPGQVESSDIGDGQVQPGDVTMPPPDQMSETPAPGARDVASADVDQGYALIDTVGMYTKTDPTSVLQLDWTGSASAGFVPCVFQLRVDGQPSGPAAGETYVQNSQTVSIASSALFDGLGAGDHSVEIWGRVVGGGGARYTCTVGPAGATIGQTVVVSEQVV